MTAATCPYCGIVIRWRRKDERCVGCGKLLPKELQADATEVHPLLPPVRPNPEEPGGAESELRILLFGVIPIGLAVVGLPLFVMSLLGVSSLALTITGAVLLVLYCPLVFLWWLVKAWGEME